MAGHPHGLSDTYLFKKMAENLLRRRIIGVTIPSTIAVCRSEVKRQIQLALIKIGRVRIERFHYCPTIAAIRPVPKITDYQSGQGVGVNSCFPYPIRRSFRGMSPSDATQIPRGRQCLLERQYWAASEKRPGAVLVFAPGFRGPHSLCGFNTPHLFWALTMSESVPRIG